MDSLAATTSMATVMTTAGDSSAENVEYISDFSWGEKLAVSILLVALSVFGTFGNGLVLYVFTRKSDKVTSTIFILSLAWCDFFTCLIIMPYTVALIQLERKLVYDVICKLYYFLITCNVPLSAFIMVAVAVDRAVTPGRARISILCLCLLAFSIGFVIACMHGVYYIGDVAVGNRSAEMDHNATLDEMDHNATLDEMDHNATLDDVIISLSKAIGNNWEWGPFSSQGTDNFSIFYYNLDGQYDRQRHHHHQQQHRNNTTPSSMASPKPGHSPPETHNTYLYTGVCMENNIIFPHAFSTLFYYIYISCYVICLLSVFTLYVLLYRTVVKSRAWRRKQIPMPRPPISPVAPRPRPPISPVAPRPRPPISPVAPRPRPPISPVANKADGENVALTPKMAGSGSGKGENLGRGGDGGGADSYDLTHEGVADSGISGRKYPAAGPGSSHKEPGCGSRTRGMEEKTSRERRDSDFLANIRTAVILFVVTIVFIISFLPAWLMSTELIDYHVFVFYMYFIYNVANPVIYAFMNQSFRNDLKRVFQRGTFTRSS